jgi:hypothetical protein
MSWKEVISILSDDDTLETVYLTVDADEDTVNVDPPTFHLMLGWCFGFVALIYILLTQDEIAVSGRLLLINTWWVRLILTT